MSDDRDLAVALTGAAREIVGAVERTADRVERLEGRVAAVERGVERAVEAADRAATATTLHRVEVRQLTDATHALLERRERTPVAVAATPRARFRWPLVLVGALGVLVAVAGLAGALYVACSGALPPGHSWAEGIERRRPAPRPRPRADMALGKSPTDTTVDPDELETDSDRAGCAPYAGALQELRPPKCRDNLR